MSHWSLYLNRETALREKNNQEREEQEQRDILERHKKEQKDVYEKYLLAINRKNEENHLRSMPTIQNIYNKINVLHKENRKQDSETAANMQNLKESTRQWMSRPEPLNNEEKYLREQQIEKELYENQLMQIQLLKKRQGFGGGHLNAQERDFQRNNAQFGLGGQIHATDAGDFNQEDEERVPRESKDKRKSQKGDYYNLGQVRNAQKPLQTPLLPRNKSIFNSKSNFAQNKVENGRYSTSNEPPPYYPSKGYPYSSSQANFDLKQQQQSQQPQSFLPPLSSQLTNQHKQVALSIVFKKNQQDRSESAKTQNSKLDGKLKPSTNSKLQSIHLDNKDLAELKFKQEQLVREKAEFKRLEALNSKRVPAIIRQNPALASQDRSNDGLLALKIYDQEQLSDTELDEASELQYGETDNNDDKTRDFKGQLDGESGQIGRRNNNFGDNSKVSGKSFFVGQHNSPQTTSLLYAQNMKERRKFWEEKSPQEEFRSQPIEEKSRITAIQKFRSKLLNNQKAAAEKASNQEDSNLQQQQNALKSEKKKSEAQIWRCLNQQEVALQREILSIHFENYEKVKQIEDKNNISLANDVNTSEILKSRAGSAMSSVTTKTNKTSKTIKSKGSSIVGQENAKVNRNQKKINTISEIENEDDLEGSLMKLEEQLNSKRTKITELQEAQAEQSKPKNPQVQRILLTIPAILQQNPFLVDLTNPDKEYLEKGKEKIQEQKQQQQQKSSPRIREKEILEKMMVSRESRLQPKSLAKEVVEQQQQSQIISSREKQPKEIKSIISSSSSSTNRASSESLLSDKKLLANKINKNNRAIPEQTKANIIMFQNQISSSKDVDIQSSPILTDPIQINSSDQSLKTQDKQLQKGEKERSLAEEKENQAENSNSSQQLNQKSLKLIEKGRKASGQTKNDEINPQIIANDKEELTKWWKSIQGKQLNEAIALGNSQAMQQQSPNYDMKPSSPKQEGDATKKALLTANSQQTIGIQEDAEKKVIDRKQQIKEEFMKQLNESETDELGYQEASYHNLAEERDSLKKGKDQLNQLTESNENKNLRNTQLQKEINKEHTVSKSSISVQVQDSKQNDRFVGGQHATNEIISQSSASPSPEPKKTLADILDKNIIARVEYSQAQIEHTIQHIEQKIETLEIQQIKAVLESKKQKQRSMTDLNNSQDNVQQDYQLSEISHNGSFSESEFSLISGVGSYTVKATIKKEYKLTGKVPSRYPHPDPTRNNSFISHNNSNSFSRLQGKDNNDFQQISEKQVILEEEDQGDIKINKNVNLQRLLFVD